MSESEQRKRFEAWAEPRLLLMRQPNGDYGLDYAYTATETAWRAWQESARQNSASSEPSPFSEPFTNPASGMGIKKQ